MDFEEWAQEQAEDTAFCCQHRCRFQLEQRIKDLLKEAYEKGREDKQRDFTPAWNMRT